MSTKLRKKTLFPLVAMVLVSVIALSSVTYAWFTTSNSASVENLNVNVEAASGIQISLDAKNWSSLFTAADITEDAYVGNTNQVPNNKIYPVSTNGSFTDGKMNMYLGELLENNNLKITKLTDTEGTSGNYIAFDLFFKMANDDTVVTLDAESLISDTENKGSDKSARVAFAYCGAADTAEAAISLKATSATIWEPVSKDTGYKGLIQATGEAGVATVNGYVDNAEYAAAVTTVEDAEDVSFTFAAGINKVRIYIWMEGQDAECINDASGGIIATKLKFVQPANP